MFSHNCVVIRNYFTAINNFMLKHFIKTRKISRIEGRGRCAARHARAASDRPVQEHLPDCGALRPVPVSVPRGSYLAGG